MKLLYVLFFLFAVLPLTGKDKVDIEGIFDRYRLSRDPKIQIKQLLKNENYSLAYRKMAEHLKSNPKDGEGYHLLGYALEKLGHVDKAEIAYKKALELAPELPDPMNNLASLYLESNRNIEEAITLVHRALAARPDDPSFLDTQALSLYRQDRHREALDILQKLIDKLPDSPALFYHLGLVLVQLNAPLEAAKAFRNTLVLAPDHFGAAKALAAIPDNPETAPAVPTDPPIQKKMPVATDSAAIVHKPNSLAASLQWREDSFKDEFESGMRSFKEQKYDAAELIWARALFWFEETGELSNWLVRAVRYLSLLKERSKDMERYREYYGLSQYMRACYFARAVRLAEEQKDFQKARSHMESLAEQLPASLKKLFEHRDKIISLHQYAQLKGEEISLVTQTRFRDFADPSFRDIPIPEYRESAAVFLRHCRTGSYEQALVLAEKLRRNVGDNPAFILDYAQVLALNERINEAWATLSSVSLEQMRSFRQDVLSLRAQLLLY
ncbi:MAG: tetratricopeptide repeat protein [Candidatus Wallbacteria bacterium]|nr:tetratricopeptide repeat protein [Candidatus Wallbacteria bacterium]